MVFESEEVPGTEKSPPEPRTRPSLLLRVRVWSDTEAWIEFARWCRVTILAECKKHHLNASEAEDIVQLVLIRLSRRMERFAYDPSRSFRGWLRSLTRSTILNYRTRGDGPGAGPRVLSVDPRDWPWPAHDPSLPDDPDDEETPDDQDGPPRWRDLRHRIAQVLKMARQRCAPDTWQSFWLTQVEGRSANEAAQALAKTPGAVRAARARVIVLLQALWDETTEPGDPR